jgi:hypothetical protein
MKLEYLDDLTGAGKYPWADPQNLIRLYDFEPAAVIALSDRLQLLIDEGHELVLSSLAFIHPVDCDLVLRISSRNIGITTVDKKMFYCDLTVEAYQQMIVLLQPFLQQNPDGYQWLYELDTAIDFLISKGGGW